MRDDDVMVKKETRVHREGGKAVVVEYKVKYRATREWHEVEREQVGEPVHKEFQIGGQHLENPYTVCAICGGDVPEMNPSVYVLHGEVEKDGTQCVCPDCWPDSVHERVRVVADGGLDPGMFTIDGLEDEDD